MLVSIHILLQTIFVILILGAMIMLLLGINQLFSSTFNTTEEDTRRLREDVNRSNDVISDQSVFHQFLRHEHVRVHNKDRRSDASL